MIIQMIDLLGLHSKDLLWYQMIIRAALIFFIAMIFIRIAGMRSFGTKTPFDVVLSITIGAVLSRCITGHYPFFECLGAAITLAFIHRFVAILSRKSKLINRLASGKASKLYEDHQLDHDRLKHFDITIDDIEKALREQNLDGFQKVKSIWLETDGKISIVKEQS